MESDKKPEETKVLTPPYLPFSTFDNFITELEGGIPAQIDKSVLAKKSGSIQAWLPNALRFFGLIQKDGVPDPELESLVRADAAGRKKLYSKMLNVAYRDLFDTVDMGKGTNQQLLDWFKSFDLSASTAARSAAFFLDMCKKAGVKVSPHFKKVSPPRRNGSSTKKQKSPEESVEVPSAGNLEQIPALRDTSITGLLEKLPEPGPGKFPEDKRKLWFEMARLTFDWVYGPAGKSDDTHQEPAKQVNEESA